LKPKEVVLSPNPATSWLCGVTEPLGAYLLGNMAKTTLVIISNEIMLAKGLSFYKTIKGLGYYYYVDNFRGLFCFINSFPPPFFKNIQRNSFRN